MAADLSKYPYRKTRDARSAMAEALRDYVKRQTFSLPKTTQAFQFAAVYENWASFSDTASTSGGKLPAAAVLPDRPIYDNSSMTPRMLEESWSGGDPSLCRDGRKLYPNGDGSGDGFALVTLAELTVPFVLLVRASSNPMRKAIVSKLEDLFLEDGTLLPDVASLNPKIPVSSPETLDAEVNPVRYGRLIEVPSYYSRKARFTLQSQQLLDTETAAIENRWLAQFEIEGQIQVCVLRRVRAMKPRVQIVADGIEESRGSSS
jgi:hypothetical protein